MAPVTGRNFAVSARPDNVHVTVMEAYGYAAVLALEAALAPMAFVALTVTV